MEQPQPVEHHHPEPSHPKNWRKIALIAGGVVLGLAAIAIVVASLVGHRGPVAVVKQAGKALQQSSSADPAVNAGRNLSNGKCSGQGPVALTALPMKLADFAMIIPYGLMIDGHVTPIDHQYFSPTVFNSAPDTYPVYALADGRITEISHRGETVGSVGKPSNDYRFVFSHTCTFLTYFDLVTSLAPDIKAEFDKNSKGSGSHSSASLDVSVKAGQLVGYIGGQTLDFAVWDTQKPLTGFVTPKLYEGERWKIYTADPLDYYSPAVKEQILTKYLRTDAGKSGKIDWDIDGKLIGNWFAVGTGGYQGDRGQGDGRYWRGHLSLAPDHLDPRHYIASFGSWKVAGDGEQFAVKSAALDPAMVDVAAGVVKYELVQWAYLNGNNHWDRKSAAKDLKISLNSQLQGCALFQMLEARKLKAEPFPGKSCASVTGFTAAATIYER